MDVRHDLFGIRDIQEHDVINPALHVIHALPRDLHGDRIPEPVLNDADVVRGEIPQGINVRADASQVKALAVNVAHLAQFTGINHLFHITDGGIVNESVADHDDQMFPRRLGGQFIDLGSAGGERFLDEHVFARRQRPGGEFKMGGRWRGDDDGVHFRISEDPVGVIHRRGFWEIRLDEIPALGAEIHGVLHVALR